MDDCDLGMMKLLVYLFEMGVVSCECCWVARLAFILNLFCHGEDDVSLLLFGTVVGEDEMQVQMG